jgi:hypothetical protein
LEPLRLSLNQLLTYAFVARRGQLVFGCCSVTLRNGERKMTNRVRTAFMTFLGVAITLASNQAFGDVRPAHGGNPHSMHSPRHRVAPHRNIGTFFPAIGGFFGGPFNGQPNLNLDVRQTITDGIYTCTYDIPWDWVHRCPPIVASPVPPPPPVAFRPGCAGQTVAVPGADGKDQTVNILRC